MSKTAPITVIVPCWNYGMFLRECLDSVFMQTVMPRHVIVANDASTDNTREIAIEYGERVKTGEFGPVNFELKSAAVRSGTIAIENMASLEVETPWMFYLDADDRLDCKYVEKVNEVIKANDDKLAIVYSDMRKFGNWEGDWVVSDWDPVALRTGNYINGHSVFRTELFREIGGLKDGPGFEDHQLWVDMLDLKRGYYGVRIPEPLVWYRRHDFGHRTDKTDIAKRS
jgi:glycosyltransferase involved in cell wall biosynthesis